jgi:hypothetical protein
MAKKKLPQDLQDWVDARKRFGLSHAHVQMARELGMNPRKLGKLANHDQEPWKAPLPEFIERIYLKSFGRARPAVVMSVEDRARAKNRKQAARNEARRRARAETVARPPGPTATGELPSGPGERDAARQDHRQAGPGPVAPADAEPTSGDR